MNKWISMEEITIYVKFYMSKFKYTSSIIKIYKDHLVWLIRGYLCRFALARESVTLLSFGGDSKAGR